MDIGWKIVSAGAGIVSGILANKAADLIWKVLFRRDHPQEDDYTEPARDALVFAAVSAAVVAIVNQVVMRRTAKWYGLAQIQAQAKKVAEVAVESD